MEVIKSDYIRDKLSIFNQKFKMILSKFVWNNIIEDIITHILNDVYNLDWLMQMILKLTFLLLNLIDTQNK